MRGILLTLRSLFWTFTCPGVVAGFIPWFYLGVGDAAIDWSDPLHLLGIAMVATGVALLGACIVDFARRGRGTLSPVDPPTVLVVAGLYRHVRNPMYLSVLTILLGQIIITRSLQLLGYAALFFALANLFVIGYEERALRRRFGESYDTYRRSVGRWLPRRTRH
ncbi:MAG: isoprenylcysteine carboxylmethyltransferase family protein [Gemmatimonadaceae bacterium]|nr:isoprenylcysteine carboxylmethyltransferase family protein [Gemmatimonadaceae bacterium]